MWRCSIWLVKTRPETDCSPDHELLTAKFRLKLKEVGKTTRLFRCDLSQIPYNYTVDVTKTFKGLDLIECLKKYGEKLVTRDSDIDHPQEKEMQKGKMIV